MEEKLAFFRENGYVVLHGVLNATEVAEIVAGMAALRAARPSEWQVSEARQKGIGAPSIGGDAPQLLERTAVLDALVFHPAVVPFARRVLGLGAALASFTYVHRLPCDIEPPLADLNEGDERCLTRQWHREYGGTIAGAHENEYFTPALQVIYYLDDVGPDNHCFSVIPESADTKRCLPTTEGSLGQRIDDHGSYGQAGSTDNPIGSYLHPEKPSWVDAYGRELARRTGGVDVHAPAGAAVILNNASFHCVTERHTTKQRRTVHVRYRQPEPLESSHGLKPPFKSVAEFNAALPDRVALRPPPALAGPATTDVAAQGKL